MKSWIQIYKFYLILKSIFYFLHGLCQNVPLKRGFSIHIYKLYIKNRVWKDVFFSTIMGHLKNVMSF